MSDWQDKSKLEINKAVAEIDPRFESCVDVEFFANDENDQAVDVVSQGVFICTVDYFYNPSDAWPIILESKIAIEPIVCFGDLWQANIKHHKEVCGNPLRAAMIVYLEMNGVKPNE